VPDGRGWRFGLEVAFLVALAVVLGIANVGASVIVIVMLAGWVLVALLEWAAWREEPHWGSGSPPRYYVPPTEIPPRRVIDQGYKVDQGYPVERGYPGQRESEAPTWIATPEMRAAALEDWPVPPPVDESDEPAAESPEARPAAVEPSASAVVPEAVVEEPPVSAPDASDAADEPAPAPEPEEEPLEAALLHEAAAVSLEEPHEPAETNGSDPWEVQSFPEGQDPRDLVLEGTRTSLHRIDPLTEPEGRRWPWQRRADGVPAGATEFPARPRHVLLPGHTESQRRKDDR
jgi:hypothetical protein